MDIKIVKGPGNAAAQLMLGPRETCTAEGGAMIAMSGNLSITTTTHKINRGGVLKAAKWLLAGESFFLNHYRAQEESGDIWLAATLWGDMMAFELDHERLIVQGGSFVACEEGVNLDMSWQGFKILLSGEHLFWLNLSGTGQVVLSSYGTIYPIEVNGQQIVDTGHIVAFQETLNFTITKAGKSWLSSFMGGEGFVCNFQGKGTVWCQSHNPRGFGKILGPKLKPR